MIFTLDSLKSGWLDARIEHNEKFVHICASNIMGGDFVKDIMVALYESIYGKVTRMVVYSNENSEFGLLFRALPENFFSIARICIEDWNKDVFNNPEKAEKDFDEAAPQFDNCGVYRGEIAINDSIFVEDLGVIEQAELIRFAADVIEEFSYFMFDKGNFYYEANWVDNSDVLTDERIQSFPREQYRLLSYLISTEQTQKPLSRHEQAHKKHLNKTINDFWARNYSKPLSDEATKKCLSLSQNADTLDLEFLKFPEDFELPDVDLADIPDFTTRSNENDKWQ